MKSIHWINISFASVMALAYLGFAPPANAACINSEWAKTSGNSLASKIFGRSCNGNMSVRFTGVVNTGWIAMQGGANQFSATFVDANVTTKITMNTNGGTMHANFMHIDNGGATSLTQGNYQLLNMQ